MVLSSLPDTILGSVPDGIFLPGDAGSERLGERERDVPAFPPDPVQPPGAEPGGSAGKPPSRGGDTGDDAEGQEGGSLPLGSWSAAETSARAQQEKFGRATRASLPRVHHRRPAVERPSRADRRVRKLYLTVAISSFSGGASSDAWKPIAAPGLNSEAAALRKTIAHLPCLWSAPHFRMCAI